MKDESIQLKTYDAAKTRVGGLSLEDEKRVAGDRSNLGGNKIFHIGGGGKALDFYVIGRELNDNKMNIMRTQKKY